MDDYRAEKSGFAKEAHDKVCFCNRLTLNNYPQMRSKYSPELASQILDWINRVSGQNLNTDGSEENFVSQLRDGIVLCK